MSPQLKRAHRLGLELEEVGETDLDGRIVLRHRTVDSLGKLLRSGAVTEAMHDAGRAFQRDFRFAGLDPIRARPMDVPLGGGRASDLTDRQLHARRRVRAAMEALGGIGSPGGSCLWHVLGCGCSVREWALRRGWSGQPLRQEQAQGILIAALGVLACRTRQSQGLASRSQLGEARRDDQALLGDPARASAPICNRDIALAFHDGARHGY